MRHAKLFVSPTQESSDIQLNPPGRMIISESTRTLARCAHSLRGNLLDPLRRQHSDEHLTCRHQLFRSNILPLSSLWSHPFRMLMPPRQQRQQQQQQFVVALFDVSLIHLPVRLFACPLTCVHGVDERIEASALADSAAQSSPRVIAPGDVVCALLPA